MNEHKLKDPRFAPQPSKFILCFNINVTTLVFYIFSLNIEGITEKVLQFIMPLKLIYNLNFGFIEQKCIFEHCR
jgi:hypothetical protein